MSSGSAKAGKASADAIIGQLKKMESPKDKEGMARYGIKTDRAFGVSLYVLRDMAKGIGTDPRALGNRDA
jgi:3-methyladenine DNA glycosylase AlkD